MNTTITVTLPKPTKERLHRLALRYGLSMAEFSQHVLEELSSAIPEESFEEYRNPRGLRLSLKRGLIDWQAGRVRARL